MGMEVLERGEDTIKGAVTALKEDYCVVSTVDRDYLLNSFSRVFSRRYSTDLLCF